jgi:hypothetical protein
VKQLQLLSLAVLGVVGAGALPGDAWGQALPPGQEAEGAVAKKPPFLGLGLDLNVWNQSGLYGGQSSYYYRNDFGFLPIPTWALGRRFIGTGRFRTLSLQARFFFNVPVAGYDETNYAGDAPSWSEQQPCATGRETSLQFRDLPRCPWGRGSRRVDYSDLTFILANPRIYTIPKIGVRVDPSVILTLPTSAQSRLRSLVLQGVAQLGVARGFWKNRIDLAYTFGYGQPFFRYASSGVTYDPAGGEVPYVGASGLSNFYTQFSAGGALQPSEVPILCQGGEVCRNPTLFVQHTIRGTVNIIDPLPHLADLRPEPRRLRPDRRLRLRADVPRLRARDPGWLLEREPAPLGAGQLPGAAVAGRQPVVHHGLAPLEVRPERAGGHAPRRGARGVDAELPAGHRHHHRQ